LIRKKSVVEASEKSSVFGITVPLLTTASGAKFGKSEGNAFWLSKEKTSPYTLYQYISNLGDEDALKLIKMLTFIPLEGLDEISREHTSNPEKRLAQRVLAKELITFIHEESDYNNAKQVSEMLFGHANTSDFKISAEEFSSICEEAGVAIHSMKKSEFFDKSPKEIASLVKLASSQSESRKLIMNGGLYINNQRVEISEMNRKLSLDDCFCDGSLCLIRSGRKKFSLVKIR
jgi:tyrosyl-tRNA synthetase